MEEYTQVVLIVNKMDLNEDFTDPSNTEEIMESIEFSEELLTFS